ncbi:type II toxin-antitoxin system RelE/ParE family toxin [Levilactobacillus cerevisiae]|uniref:type II toxin-antitoxin system RelE/ParE family toxin n=1 Tax=Levilactobacillus cerevisiae TaxID=1704076 RepID=UPI000F7A5A2B|nr:type II toxin-antitoxin system RelE/ParE family toxin [Levilactobacillus cerevisiae]
MGEAKFVFYDQGEFNEFLDGLPKKDAQKLTKTILLIEKYGLITAKSMKWIKKLEKNLYEIRSSVGNNSQRAIYFQLQGDVFVITHGFTKKTNRTPESEKGRGRSDREFYLKHGGK